MHTTVLIAHHLNENQVYLDLCLKSVYASVGASFDVMVLADTPNPPVVPTGVKLIHDRALDTATKKANLGMKLAAEKSDCFLFLGDDAMVSKHLIRCQSEICSIKPMILNPYSNNDAGSVYMGQPLLVAYGAAPLGLRPNMDYRDIAGYEQAVIDYQTYDQILIPRHFVPFFCTMIPKEIYQAVGDLDERFDLRHNDEDYCIRARNKGYMTAINFGVFALHFGGKTLDQTVSMEQRDECTEAFAEKWGLQK